MIQKFVTEDPTLDYGHEDRQFISSANFEPHLSPTVQFTHDVVENIQMIVLQS